MFFLENVNYKTRLLPQPVPDTTVINGTLYLAWGEESYLCASCVYSSWSVKTISSSSSSSSSVVAPGSPPITYYSLSLLSPPSSYKQNHTLNKPCSRYEAVNCGTIWKTTWNPSGPKALSEVHELIFTRALNGWLQLSKHFVTKSAGTLKGTFKVLTNCKKPWHHISNAWLLQITVIFRLLSFHNQLKLHYHIQLYQDYTCKNKEMWSIIMTG